MVRILSRDTSAGLILFRMQLPTGMLFVDHVLRSNLFPLQHVVQRRGAILEALYSLSEGFWFSPLKLIMSSLFHFEEKIHRKHLSRAETILLLFPRLLSHVLEHLGFPVELHQERRRVCEATFIVEKLQFVPGALLFSHILLLRLVLKYIPHRSSSPYSGAPYHNVSSPYLLPTSCPTCVFRTLFTSNSYYSS